MAEARPVSTNKSRPQIKVGDYQLGNCIGKGSYGTVYRGLNMETGEVVAVKVFSLEGMDAEEQGSLMAEVELLSQLSHPHIVKYLNFEKTSENLHIILEFLENGSLLKSVQHFGRLPEKLIAFYTKQAVKGLEYLHSKDVIHCDIKAANILTTKKGDVKLTDFGVSKQVKDARKDVAQGSPYWMAPEVIELKGASTASDIWSLGCTVIELLTGMPPYGETRAVTAMFQIVENERPPLPPELSPDLQDFLLKCLQRDPKERWTASDLLHHPFLQNVKGSEIENPILTESMANLSSPPSVTPDLKASPPSVTPEPNVLAKKSRPVDFNIPPPPSVPPPHPPSTVTDNVQPSTTIDSIINDLKLNETKEAQPPPLPSTPHPGLLIKSSTKPILNASPLSEARSLTMLNELEHLNKKKRSNPDVSDSGTSNSNRSSATNLHPQSPSTAPRFANLKRAAPQPPPSTSPTPAPSGIQIAPSQPIAAAPQPASLKGEGLLQNALSPRPVSPKPQTIPTTDFSPKDSVSSPPPTLLTKKPSIMPKSTTSSINTLSRGALVAASLLSSEPAVKSSPALSENIVIQPPIISTIEPADAVNDSGKSINYPISSSSTNIIPPTFTLMRKVSTHISGPNTITTANTQPGGQTNSNELDKILHKRRSSIDARGLVSDAMEQSTTTPSPIQQTAPSNTLQTTSATPAFMTLGRPVPGSAPAAATGTPAVPPMGFATPPTFSPSNYNSIRAKAQSPYGYASSARGKKEKTELEGLFELYDSNHKGAISIQQGRKILTSCGVFMDDQEWHDIFANSGIQREITYAELDNLRMTLVGK